MTRPVGRAAIELTADASRLGPSIEREADKALRATNLNLKPIADQIVKGVRDGVDGAGAPLKHLSEEGRKAFATLAEAADKALRETAKDADRGGADIGEAIQKGAGKATRAVDEMADKSRSDFARIEGNAERSGEGISGAFRKVASVVGLAFATLQVGRYFKDATLSAQSLGSAIANTVKIIDSTRGAAGLLASDVRNIAQQLSFKIGVDSVEVQDAINILLTFRSVSGPVLATAIGLAADLSAVFGMGLSGAATQLGKALQDPLRGIGALSRVGVSFSQVQKDQIKGFVDTNQLAKAQAVILDEVATEVGGVAEAGADTTDKLANAFMELKRDAGEAIIELVDAAGPALLELAQALGPAFKAAGVGVAGILHGLMPILVPLVGAIGTALEHLGPALGPLGAALGQVGAALAPLIRPLGALIAAFATGLTPIIGALAPLLAGLASTITFALAPLAPIVEELGQAFGSALLPIAQAVGDAFTEAGPLIVTIVKALAGALVDLGPGLGEVLAAVVDVAPAFAQLLVPALQLVLTLLTPLLPLIGPLATALAGPLAGAITGVAAVIGPLTPLLETLTSFFAANPELVYVLAGAILAYTVVSKASAVATAIAAGVTDIWTASVAALDIALAILSSPITIVVVAIAALVAGVILAYKHVGWFRAAVDAVGHALVVAGKAIVDFAVGAWNAVTGFFSQLGHNLTVAWTAVGDFVEGVGQFFADLPRKVGEFLSELPARIGHALQAAFDNALVLLGEWLGLMFVVGSRLPGVLIDALVTLPPRIGGFILGALLTAGGAVRDGFAAVGRALWDGILHLGQLVIDGWHATIDFLVSLPSRVWAAVSAIPGIVSNAFHAAGEFARAQVLNLLSFIASIPDRIAAFRDRMLRAGLSLIQGFMDGFRRFGNFVGNLASDIGSAIKGFLNHVIGQLNVGISKVDDALPFSLPRIPMLARGGLTQGQGLAMLHPSEAILPLEDARVTDLLARAMAEAQQGLQAAGVGTFGGPINIRVYLGTREITDIVGVEIDERNRSLYQRVTAGSRRAGVP